MKNLICFFSWGRSKLTKKSFLNLLEHKRESDRLLVIDNEGLNSELYKKYIDNGDIDFLTIFKLNYNIGPVWVYIKNFVEWKRDIKGAYKFGDEKAWYPDFINIVESDAIGNKGWISELEEVFKKDPNITIVSGFDSPHNGAKEEKDGIKYKKLVSGVQVMFRTDYFIEVARYFEKYGQDKHVSIINMNNHKKIAILANKIIHIGDEHRTRE